MRALTFEVVGESGGEQRRVAPRRVFNFGSATRSPDSALAHQREVADIGIRIAFDVPPPRIYPISPPQLTTDDVVYVLNDRTSGEVEYAVVVSGGELFVGVASDHTDRELEVVGIPWSKEICPNVIAPRLWRWSEVREHWDECLIECWIDGELYQSNSVAVFLRPDELVALVDARVGAQRADVALLSGSYASLGVELRFGTVWEFRLVDPRLDREIRHRYEVVDLRAEIPETYRVPLTVGP